MISRQLTLDLERLVERAGVDLPLRLASLDHPEPGHRADPASPAEILVTPTRLRRSSPAVAGRSMQIALAEVEMVLTVHGAGVDRQLDVIAVLMQAAPAGGEFEMDTEGATNEFWSMHRFTPRPAMVLRWKFELRRAIPAGPPVREVDLQVRPNDRRRCRIEGVDSGRLEHAVVRLLPTQQRLRLIEPSVVSVPASATQDGKVRLRVDIGSLTYVADVQEARNTETDEAELVARFDLKQEDA